MIAVKIAYIFLCKIKVIEINEHCGFLINGIIIKMAKPTSIKDAIKKWEDAHPGKNIAEATDVGFQFQWLPIEKMDNSLAALTSCK